MPPKRNIYICRPVDAVFMDAQAGLFQDARWIYFGRNAAHYYAVAGRLKDRATGLNSGELINETARSLWSSFVNLDQTLDDGTFLTQTWHATAVAENNPYMSDLFYQCCADHVTDRILKEHTGDLMIVTEDVDFLIHLAQTLSDLGNVRLPYPPSRYRLYRRLTGALRWISARTMFLFRNVKRKITLSLLRRRHAKLRPAKGAGDNIFVVWGDHNTFKAGQRLERDSYYGELAGSFYQDGQSLRFLVLPVVWMQPYGQIVASALSGRDEVIFPEDCVSWADYGKILRDSAVRRACRLPDTMMLEGRDVSGLFRRHMAKEGGRLAYLETLKFYRIGHGLIRQFGAPQRLIHLFENQPWEKMLRMGIKEAEREVRIIGCQHAPFPQMYLNYFPSRRCIAQDHLPDQVVSIGPVYQRIFKEHGYKEEVLKAGAAFRYQYLFGIRPQLSPDPRRVLIATSISYEESMELIYKTLAYFCRRSEYRVMIKFHPKLARQKHLLGRVLHMLHCPELPAHVEVVQEGMETLLSRTGVVFYNFTAVCYEAMARHIPVVFVCSDIWLDMNKLDWFSDVDIRVTSEEDIDRTMRSLTETDAGKKDAWIRACDRAVRESFTEPRQEELISVYR